MFPFHRSLLAVAAALAVQGPNAVHGPEPRADGAARARLRAADARLVESMRQELQRPETCPHDVRLRAAALGFDPARLLAFVQREVRFEPYAGLQRGAAGTLVARAGNAADKAALLAELLRTSGFDARLVTGPLTAEQAGGLLAAARSAAQQAAQKRPPAGPFGTAPADGRRLREICAGAGLAADGIAAAAEAGERERQEGWDELLALTAREERWLRGSAEAAGLWTEPAAVEPQLLEAVREHCWVQWRSAPDAAWTDADPCADGQGGRLCSASGVTVDAAELADRFTLKLTLRRRNPDGGEEEVPLLEHSVGLADALLRPLRFRIDPADSQHPWPREAEHLDLDATVARFRAMKQFQGVLLCGTEAFGSRVFDYEGNAFTVANNGALGLLGGAVQRGLGGAADVLGAGAGTGTRELLSLFVDFEVQRRDRPLWSQRRVLLEPGRRADWCPVLSWDLFFHTQPLTPAFARAMTLEHRVRNDAGVSRLFDWAAAEGKGGPLEGALGAREFFYPLDLLRFCVARSAWLESRGGGAQLLSFDRPNLLLSGQRVRFKPGAQKLCLCYGIDLVENGATVLTAGDRGFAADRAATSGLGVFDTALELALVREANEPEAQSGTIPFFERARALGRPAQFVAAADGAALLAAGVPAVDAEWIRAGAEAGQRVLVADGGPGSCCSAFAWWAYDPATGRVVGRISGGLGGCESEVAVPACSSLVEHIFTVVNVGLCAINVFAAILHGHYGHAAAEAMICAFLGRAAHVAKGPGGTLLIEAVDLLLNVNGLATPAHE